MASSYERSWSAFGYSGVASAYAGGDGQTAGTLAAGGRKERRRAMVGEMERFLRKESLSIVAADPSTVAESAGAAADNTDQDNRIPAGPSSQRRRRHHTGSLHTASNMKNEMGSEGKKLEVGRGE